MYSSLDEYDGGWSDGANFALPDTGYNKRIIFAHEFHILHGRTIKYKKQKYFVPVS